MSAEIFADAPCLQPVTHRKGSRHFENAGRTYANGKTRPRRLHPSMSTFHGVFREKRAGEPDENVYVEGTHEPASTR